MKRRSWSSRSCLKKRTECMGSERSGAPFLPASLLTKMKGLHRSSWPLSRFTWISIPGILRVWALLVTSSGACTRCGCVKMTQMAYTATEKKLLKSETGSGVRLVLFDITRGKRERDSREQRDRTTNAFTTSHLTVLATQFTKWRDIGLLFPFPMCQYT
jgi:hypothetical protein